MIVRSKFCLSHPARGARGGDGFSLVELSIAMAIMLLLIGSVFAVNFRVSGLWSSERRRSEMQQNFRFALDTVTEELRQADTVSLPGDNSLGEQLGFRWTNPDDGLKYDVGYSIATTADGRRIVQRTQRPVVGTGEKVTAVTEDLNSLAALHFIRSGRRIIIMLVARYDVLGSQQTISYTTETFVRSNAVSSPY